jgi:cell division protein ZapA
MQDDKVQVTVVVFGETYTLRGDEDSQHITQLAKLVDDVLQSVHSQNPHLSHSQTVILGALEIADRYMKLQRDYSDLITLLEPSRGNGTEP